MTNAFLAALLKMAAEERLHAERLRNCKIILHSPTGATIAMSKSMNDGLEKDAQEHEGRAEVYERFAHRIIADTASDLILAEFEKLDGRAELLNTAPEQVFEMDYKLPWDIGHWYQGNSWPPSPIIGFMTN